MKPFKTIRFLIILIFVLFAGIRTVHSEAFYRVQSAYEDSIRIVLIWNDAPGLDYCDSSTLPIGRKTMEFVSSALNPAKVPNIKFLQNSTNDKTTWEDVQNLWGGDTIPHVLVHINAGWSGGWNGDELDEIFESAIRLKIGIVSIGDDAASLASNTFGFRNVENVPAPLGDATNIDSLWIGLLRANDEKVKARAANSKLSYPGLNGIISNTVDSILKDSTMHFLPFGGGRCQADADKYNSLYPTWITMLGYQQGYFDNEVQPGPNELNVLVAIQDTTEDDIIRRGVALSYQPGFLQNKAASEQIVYDAIMFGSLTHTLSVANRLSIKLSGNEVRAGKSLPIAAEIIDNKGDPMDELLQFVQWEMIAADTNDKLSRTTGDTTLFSATKAWRNATVRAWVTDFETGITLEDTAIIHILPGDPHHFDIQTEPEVSNDMLNNESPQHTIRLSINSPYDTVYAVIRDTYNNYVSKADSSRTIWKNGNPIIAEVNGIPSRMYAGVVIMNKGGKTVIEVTDNSLIADTAIIETESVIVKSAITKDTNGNGFLDRIELHFDVPVNTSNLTLNQHSISVFHNSNQFQIAHVHAKSALDSIIFIDLTENDSWGFQTGWELNIDGYLPVTISDDNTENIDLSGYTVLDGAGPVIAKVVLHPGFQGTADTLKLTLSEPVNNHQLSDVQPESAYRYYLHSDLEPEERVFQGATQVISDTSQFIENLYILVPSTTEQPFQFTPYKDKMQYVFGSTDKSGNNPPDQTIARKTVVESGGQNSIILVVFPNPLIPGSIKNWPSNIKTRYSNIIKNQNEGILVVIKTRKPLAPSNSSFGSANIYDALGNNIKSGFEILKTTTNLEYALFWNGRNKQERIVGRGVYLAVLNMTDIEGGKYNEKVKLGVKR